MKAEAVSCPFAIERLHKLQLSRNPVTLIEGQDCSHSYQMYSFVVSAIIISSEEIRKMAEVNGPYEHGWYE